MKNHRVGITKHDEVLLGWTLRSVLDHQRHDDCRYTSAAFQVSPV